MSEEELREHDARASGEAGDEADVPVEGELPETEIRDTDIVFDCPHCGHNLAIDYRGAGLQINCVNCGESVLVPIPDGMKIDDLDIEPGEILKQLFATRRHLQKAELRIDQLEQELEQMALRRDALQAALAFAKVQVDEVKNFVRRQADVGEKITALLERMEGDLNADVPEVEALGQEAEGEAGEDGARDQ